MPGLVPRYTRYSETRPLTGGCQESWTPLPTVGCLALTVCGADGGPPVGGWVVVVADGATVVVVLTGGPIVVVVAGGGPAVVVAGGSVVEVVVGARVVVVGGTVVVVGRMVVVVVGGWVGAWPLRNALSAVFQ